MTFEPGWFNQVSDQVAKSTILAVTKDCKREDCDLSARELETTLAGISNSYDKQGNIVFNNSNRRSTGLTCRICWKSWIVKQKGDEILGVELLPNEKI